VKDKLFWVLAFVVFLILAFLVDEPQNPSFLPSTAIRILLAANLTLFLFLLNRFVGQPVNQTLKTRGEGVKEELAEARRKLVEAESLRAEVSERLARVEAEVMEIQERADALGKAEAEKIDAQAREDEARFMRRVDDQITRRQAETRERLAKDTAALTEQLTKELLQSTMTETDQQRVLDRSLGALENLPGKE
jgi:F-type H+-transporting ATPase subunit b